jgi:DNA processing protein
VVYRLLRHDEKRPIDEIMELLDGQLTSAEVFTALFELELAGHIKQLPGKNYVRCM